MFRSLRASLVSDFCQMSSRHKPAGVAAAACSYVSVRVLDGKLGERPPGSGAHSHSVDGGSCLRFPPNPETLPASSQLTAPGGPCQE